MYKILKRCRWGLALLAITGFAQVAPLGHRWYGQTVGSFLAREIAAGGGAIWAIGSEATGGGNYSVGEINQNRFEKVTGQAVRIAVDGTGTPWVITAQGGIWKRESGNWKQMPGGGTEIAAGGDQVWVLGGTTRGVNNSIYRWNGSGWVQVPGTASKIALSPSGTPYAITTMGDLWKYDSALNPPWRQIAGGINHVSVSRNVETAKDKDLILAATTAGRIVTFSDGVWYASTGEGQPDSAIRTARDERSAVALAIVASSADATAGYVISAEPNESASEAGQALSTAVSPGPLFGYRRPAPGEMAAAAAVSQASKPADWMMASGRNWMSFLPDRLPLNRISIPGTHDSGARDPDISHGTVIGIPVGAAVGEYVQCQTWTIEQQLNAGIRYLDIRTASTTSGLDIFHGDFYLRLSYAQVMSAVNNFLTQNPRETVIMRVKANEKQAAAGAPAWLTWWQQYKPVNGVRFSVLSSLSPMPALGDLRGKIVLLYDSFAESFGVRFGDPNTYLQDAYQIVGSSGDLRESATLAEKGALISQALTVAANSTNTKLVLNHLSAMSALYPPHGVAKGTNPGTLTTLESLPPHRVHGTLIMDFPGEKLIEHIIQSNFFVN